VGAADAGPMGIEWEETAVWRVAETVRQSTAEGRERTRGREYRGGRAEEVENGVLFCVKTQRDRARREARRIRVGEKRFMRQK
jgi:hypothetical protein